MMVYEIQENTRVKGIKKKMKKLTKSFLVMIQGLLMSVNVMADVQTGKTGPDYPTDYYMIVESKGRRNRYLFTAGSGIYEAE